MSVLNQLSAAAPAAKPIASQDDQSLQATLLRWRNSAGMETRWILHC